MPIAPTLKAETNRLAERSPLPCHPVIFVAIEHKRRLLATPAPILFSLEISRTPNSGENLEPAVGLEPATT
jgi:hypothetical protein